MKAITNLRLLAMFVSLSLCLLGCLSKARTTGEGKTSFNFQFTSILNQVSSISSIQRSPAAAESKAVSGAYNFRFIEGHLRATNAETSETQVLDWSVYLNNTTWEVRSNKSITLYPGAYDFTLELTEGNNKYFGKVYNREIVDGINNIAMTISPVIGDTSTDVSVVGRVADFKFSYNPAELEIAGFETPKLGVIVDDKPEEIFLVNPSTGVLDSYIILPAGAHDIRLRLYDGQLQRGKSVPAQETVNVTPGTPIVMDLAPLHSDIILDINEEGGDATFDFTIPEEVVNEAGGSENLNAVFSFNGDKNNPREVILVLREDGNNYKAQATFPGLQYDELVFSLSFSEVSSSEPLGSCEGTFVLNKGARAISCEITLRRRAVASGNLLGVLNLNVVDKNWEPVFGASLYAGEKFIGLSGGESKGHLKTLLRAGDYTIKAKLFQDYAEEAITLHPFDIKNLNMILQPSIYAKLALQHMEEVMDMFHNSFDVYTDFNAGGNHFYPSGWMGDATFSLSIEENSTSDVYSGVNAIKVSCANIRTHSGGDKWAGVYWQNPENNWGTMVNAGYNLSGASKISFWAKGEEGGTLVEFFGGGITGQYPDSLSKTSAEYVFLSNHWKQYNIDLSGKDLSHVIGGFGFALSRGFVNPSVAVFYLDDIKYELSRLDEPRFVNSYQILATDSPILANVSYIYDNALALLAFLADGTEDSLRRAKIIADAFVYAQNNDRHYTDGRLRNAYMSGDLTDHETQKTKLPGWWDTNENKWFEDEFSVSTHTGNMAWAMIALLSYYEKSGGEQYLEAAKSMGEWIERETSDTRGAGGYTAGYEGWSTATQKLLYKATEHNIDLHVAFMRLYQITQEDKWEERALHAKNFVDAMWNQNAEHFWTGSKEDGVSINTDTIPLDIQAWAMMAMPSETQYRNSLNWAGDNCYTEKDGFRGFDFDCNGESINQDGIWFEGTAQMALAYQINQDTTQSVFYLSELRKAQTSAQNHNGKGIVSASRDGVSTGFNWEYFSRLHIGATAWFIFAERGLNPFWDLSAAQ